ncbi:MAG: metalloregulator ArsR/SmtB family transcription factor [Chloroflexi bacterium]|nr:metalloregulator ArsR/SmtB family transcription factor [Chloroflexota bacterium]
MSANDLSLPPDSNTCTEPDAASVAAARNRMVADAPARDLADLFRALGDPTRVRILSALADAEVCVNDLTAALEMRQSAVSHQLAYLREVRLVSFRREGKHAYYRLDDDHVRGLFVQGLDHVTNG